jgi:hypothetical protein
MIFCNRKIFRKKAWTVKSWNVIDIVICHYRGLLHNWRKGVGRKGEWGGDESRFLRAIVKSRHREVAFCSSQSQQTNTHDTHHSGYIRQLGTYVAPFLKINVPHARTYRYTLWRWFVCGCRKPLKLGLWAVFVRMSFLCFVTAYVHIGTLSPYKWTLYHMYVRTYQNIPLKNEIDSF